jgi:hypothetical protein
MEAKAGWIVAVAVLVAAVSGGAASAGRLITGAQIQDRSVATRDLALSARPKAGRVGPVGPDSGPNAVRAAETQPIAYGPFSSDSSVISLKAVCPAGTTLVGGGYRHLAKGATFIAHSVIHNAPAADNGWGIILVNLDETGDAKTHRPPINTWTRSHSPG